MAILPTADALGRIVLETFANHEARPNHALRGQTILAAFINRKFYDEDISTGIGYAIDQGWVVKTPSSGLKLTEAGFAAM